MQEEMSSNELTLLDTKGKGLLVLQHLSLCRRPVLAQS